jgi:small conductance mechanosensitive channel
MIQAARGIAQDTSAAALDSTLSQFVDWRVSLAWDRILPALVKVVLVVAVAVVAYRLIKVLIQRLLEREIDAEDPVVKRLREQRAQTLGSLLGNVALIVIVTLTMLTVLGLFVNIGPLLASVGVLGLAVSFGAQSLVKDIISGTFMLLEGQFGIGDVVQIADVSGVVEKITLRTTVLRDVQGAVHIIPNGEITRVSNLTKTWSRALLDVAIAYKEDIDRVIEILQDVGRELQADPEWGALLIEEPVVHGVERFADSGMIIRMTAKTLPEKQWGTARELRRRIKKRFDQEKIEPPPAYVTVAKGQEATATGARAGRQAYTDEVTARGR